METLLLRWSLREMKLAEKIRAPASRTQLNISKLN